MFSETVNFVWLHISHVNLFVSGPKFTTFFRQTWEGL